MEHSLASWVPVDVLVGALTVVLGYIFKRVTDDNKKQTDAITKLAEEFQAMRLQQTNYATLEQLGRMGDRFDGRVTVLAQDVAVMKAVQERK